MSLNVSGTSNFEQVDFHELYTAIKQKPMSAATKSALKALEEFVFASIDVGSGSISATPFTMMGGLVFPTAEKEEVKRAKKDAQEIGTELRKAFGTENLKNCYKFFTGSEWLRSLEKGSEQDSKLKLELDQIAKEENEKGNLVSMEVLSQLDETQNSSSYFQHVLPYLNKQNPYLANVNKSNSAQCEVGNGSGQGMIMPIQKNAVAGKAVEGMIAAGQSVEEIVKNVSASFLGDMIETPGLEHLFLQGLLAVTLSKDEVVKGLGIKDKNAWKTCQISFPVSEIIDILKQQKADGTFTTTLAFLTAVQQKYGNIQIFNMKEPMPLFDAQGKALTFVTADGEEKLLLAKINSAGGQALKVITFLFNHIYNATEAREELGLKV